MLDFRQIIKIHLLYKRPLPSRRISLFALILLKLAFGLIIAETKSLSWLVYEGRICLPSVANGMEALRKAEEQPGLILFDIMMPSMDGFQTCTRLKENEAARDIPVIFLSALNDTRK